MDIHGHSSTGDVHSSTGDVVVYLYMYSSLLFGSQLVHKLGDLLVLYLSTNYNINCIKCMIILNMNTCDDPSYLLTHRMLLYPPYYGLVVLTPCPPLPRSPQHIDKATLKSGVLGSDVLG